MFSLVGGRGWTKGYDSKKPEYSALLLLHGQPCLTVVVLYLVHKEERGEDLAFLALIFTQLSRQKFHTFSL
jgi:hypothetical protein